MHLESNKNQQRDKETASQFCTHLKLLKHTEARAPFSHTSLMLSQMLNGGKTRPFASRRAYEVDTWQNLLTYMILPHIISNR